LKSHGSSYNGFFLACVAYAWIAGVEAAELADAAVEVAPLDGTLPLERAACAFAAFAALSQRAALRQQPGAHEALVAMLHGAANFDEEVVSSRAVVCIHPMHAIE
jgi:hypothetical protein